LPQVRLLQHKRWVKVFGSNQYHTAFFEHCDLMYNIILVCAHHSEFGKCNSDELYKIIESIRPDIIFEELTQDLFDMFYKENNIPFELPEIKSVRRYIKNHTTSHFPIDIYLSSTLSSSEINYLFDTVGKHHVYSKLEEEQKKLAFQEGYDFPK
jgi:hypothetical protein